MKKFFKMIDKAVEVFATALIVLMTVIIAYQVFMRSFYSDTPRWSEEVAMLLMVWFGFIGIGIGVKKKIHICIEYFVDICPEKLKNFILFIDDILVGFFGATLFYYGTKLVMATSTSILPATKWPSSTLYLMVPVSGFMIVCYTLIKMVSSLMSKFSEVDYD